MRGPTKRQLAAGQIRSLRAMRKKLLNMSTHWDGLGQFNLGVLEDLADRIEAAAVELIDEESAP